MADLGDDNQYLVHPQTGKVGIVPKDQVESFLSENYKPASAQQIAQYDATVSARRAAREDVLGAPKAFASALGQGTIGAITNIPYLATSLVPSATELSETLYNLPGLRSAISEDTRAELHKAAEQDKAIRQGLARQARKISYEELEQKAFGTTPEMQKAREDIYSGASTAGLVTSFLTPMALEKGVAKIAERGAAATAQKTAALAASDVASEQLGRAIATAVDQPAAEAAVLRAQEARSLLPPTATPAEVAASDAAVTAAQQNAARVSAEAARQQQIALGQAARVAGEHLAPEVEAAAAESLKASAQLAKATEAELKAQPGVFGKAAKLAQKYGVSTPGLLSKAGEATTELAEKATVPIAGLATRPLGMVAEPLTERMAQSGFQSLVEAAPTISNLPKMTQDVLGKAAAKGLGTALEFSLLNVGQGVHEDILGNHELTAERALAHASEGALGNFALGAGLSVLPPALNASLSALGLTTRITRDAAMKALPSLWQRLSGVTEDEAKLLMANREALRTGETTVADLIKQDIQRTQPLAEPAAPVAPIEPAPLVKEGEISENAARLTESLRDQHDAVNRVRKEFKSIVMGEEAAKAIDAHVAAQKLAARQAFTEAWGGKAKTPAYWRGVKQAEEEVMKPYRNLGTSFAKNVFRVTNRFLKDPVANIPENTFYELHEIAKKAMDLSEMAKTPGQIQRGMADLKFQIYDLIPRQRSVLQSLSTDRRIAARAASEAYGLAKDITIDPQLWGDAAAQIAKADEVATALYGAEKDVFNTKGGLGELVGKQPRFSKQSVSNLVRKLDTEEAADKIERLTNWQKAVRDYEAMVKDYAAASERSFGLPELGQSIAKADQKYSAVQAKVAQSVEDAAAAERYGAELRGYKGDVKSYKRDLKAYDQQLAQRAEFAAERAKVLGDVASTAKNVDTVAATSLALGLLTKSSVLESVAALLKSGQILTNPTQAMKTLAWLEKGAKVTENLSRGVAEKLIKGGAPIARDVIGVTRSVGSMKQEREEYERRVAKLDGMTGDVAALGSHLDSAVDQIATAAPKIAEQARAKKAQAIGLLAGSIPQPPASLAPFQRKNWQPTDQQVRTFNRTYDAVAYPKSVLAKIADGTATAEEMSVMKTVYPALIADTREKILEMLKENPNIPAPRRQMLSKMLGIDVDGSAQMGLTAQSVYQQAQTPPDAKQQMPVSRAKGLDLSGRAGAETRAWMAAQDGIGSWNKTNK